VGVVRPSLTRPTLATLLLALSLGLGPAAISRADPAPVATFGATPPTLTAGPFIGGDGLVWVQATANPAAADVVTQAPGAAARILGTIPSPESGSGDQLQVEVSGGYLAYGYVADHSGHFGPEPVSSLVAAGPLAGPYKPLASCSSPAGDARFSLAGSLIAYTPGCAAGSPLSVLDLASGARQPFAAPPNSTFKLAGDYLAVRTDADSEAVSVYRRSSGQEVYRAGPGAPLGQVEVGDFDLQSDGKLAAAFLPLDTSAIGGSLIAWFSPADPTPHVVPLPQTVTGPHRPSYSEPLRIAADRIVFSRPESPCSYQNVSDLLESDLQGNVVQIDRIASGPQAIPFDFDGTTVGWLGDPGGVSSLLTEDLTTALLPAAGPVAPHCPTLLAPSVRVTSRVLRISPSGGRAHLLVACLDRAQANQTPGQCALDVKVRTSHRVRLTKHGRPAVLDLTPRRTAGPLLNLTISPGRSGTLPIVLDSRAQALLRRVRRLPLVITVTDYFTRARLAQADVTLTTRR
jgi:hypothetical protein